MREQRRADELRPTSIDTAFNRYAEGSAWISFGETRVLCTASVEESQSPFLRGCQKGWVTAEDKPLYWDQVMQLKRLADQGIADLAAYQLQAVR